MHTDGGRCTIVNASTHTQSLQMYSGETHPCTDTLPGKHIAGSTSRSIYTSAWIHTFAHLHIFVLLPLRLLLVSFQALPWAPAWPELLPPWLGHLAGCVCVWRGRENLEKGRSEEREVGCSGHWPALVIDSNTT